MDDIEVVDLDNNVKKNSQNNQKFPIGTIVVFLILLLIIGGYFVYDIFFNKEEVIREFSFKEEIVTMQLNEVHSLESSMNLNNLNISDIIFSLDNTDIVFIDNYSLISGNEVGEVILKASYKDIEQTLKVSVMPAVSTQPKMSFAKNSIDLNQNSSKRVFNYLTIENIDEDDVTFLVSNPDVADVIGGNIVTYEENGETTITAIYKDIEVEMNVVVGKRYLYFKEEEITLEKDSEFDIVEYLNYLGIDNLTVVYKVTDLSILYVDRNKIFTRSKEGQTEITATYGDLFAKITVNVE